MTATLGSKPRLLALLVACCCGLLASAVSVKDFGAKGDGRHIDSPAINAAIRQAADEGGGVVVLTEGVYLCYSVRLQSGVTLRLERGAVLKAAPVSDTEGYDPAEPNATAPGEDCARAPLWTHGVDLSRLEKPTPSGRLDRTMAFPSEKSP